MTSCNKPIPLLKLPNSWQDISISDSHERLVALGKLNSKSIFVKPMYYMNKIPKSLNDCFVREEVAELLIKAARLLPTDYKLLVYDGFRPFEVQMHLYRNYYAKLRDLNPQLDENELNNLVRQFVSVPSNSLEAPSTHITGGAVDVTLIYNDGKEVDLGTSFDDFTEIAKTRYFEEKIDKGIELSLREKRILEHRRLLFHTFIDVGFVNFANEWWHFDYGNQWWASIKKQDVAKYGLVQYHSSE